MSTPAPRSPEAQVPPQAKPKRRCRSLTIKGIQCNSSTLPGGNFCHTHSHYRHPECPKKGSKIVMPLLEDHSAIQLILSQVAHGIFSGELDNATARSLSYVCQVAAFTLPRPVAAHAKSAVAATIQEPVAEVVTTPDGEYLGPLEKYQGPTGTFEPQWSWSKYLYEKECEQLGETKPTCAADYPASGWLTEEEMKEDPDDWKKRTKAHKAELYKVDQARKAKETAAAIAAGLPDPHLKRVNPDCPHDILWCDGPNHRHHCYHCGNDIRIAAGLPPVDLDKIAARNAAKTTPPDKTLAKPTAETAAPDKAAPPKPTPPKPALVDAPKTEGQPIGDLKACTRDTSSTARCRRVIKLDNTRNPCRFKSMQNTDPQGGGPRRQPILSRVRSAGCPTSRF
jgi:hypothetical protein